MNKEKIERILAISIISLAIIFGSLCIFFDLAGKSVISKGIESLTHRKTRIGYISFTPPLNLEIGKLNIEGLAKIDSIYISPSIVSLFTGKLVLNRLKFVSPEFTYVRTPPAVISEQKTGGVDLILPVQPKPIVSRFLPLGFKRIRIENGVVNYIDQSISADGIKIVLKDINCKVKNLYFFPRDVVTNLELKGKMPWREGQESGQLEIKGWFNFLKKSMEATFRLKDIDAIYLRPYYAAWVDLEKARIEKAKLNFSVDINGLNNNVNAACHLALTDLVRKPLEPGQSEEKASKLTNKVIDIFRATDQGQIELNFSVKTKMDSPKLGFGNFAGAFEDKIAQGREVLEFKPEKAILLPLRLLEGGVKGISDLTKAMVDGIFAIGTVAAQSSKQGQI
jgi:hypothetical protein